MSWLGILSASEIGSRRGPRLALFGATEAASFPPFFFSQFPLDSNQTPWSSNYWLKSCDGFREALCQLFVLFVFML